MSEESVLKRIVSGPKMRISGFPAMEPLCSAFASVAATLARNELRPGIDVTVYGYEVIRHGDYLRQLRAPSAIYIVAFEGGGGTGLVKAHPRLLGKVLDLSLGGDGSFEDSGSARALTPIDLAIYGRFVDLVGRAFEEAVLELCGRSTIGRPKKVKFEEQPGMVRIAPDRSEVFVIKLNFHIADDKRGAGVDLVVPISVLEPLKRDLNSAASASDASSEIWAKSLFQRVLDISLKTDGVISLGKFTVGELSRLEQGQIIELPDNAIDDVELQLETCEGTRTLTKGKLGAKGRHKAVRLSQDIDADFVRPLADMMDQERPTLATVRRPEPVAD